MPRNAKMHRTTEETDVSVNIKLDGVGNSLIQTGIGFFDHLLTILSKHSDLDLQVAAKGDLQVDQHHTVEDVGIVLGQVLDQALGSRHGILRFGYAYCPLDESLARSVIDISGRSFFHFQSCQTLAHVGGFDGCLLPEFLRAIAFNAKLTVHVDLLRGQNQHHIQEAIIKSFGCALKMAVAVNKKGHRIPSSKGTLV